MREKRRHAVVLSGGGADGAYEVGVLKALVNGKSPATNFEPIDPEIFTGTSIGAFNASFLVSQWDDYGPAAIGNLEKVWLERMAAAAYKNGGFRIRFDPFRVLDPRSYLEDPVRSLRELATDTVELGWDGVQRGVNLAIGKGPLVERVLNLFNLASFVAPEPWEETLREVIDYKKIRRSKKRLLITATNWVMGEVREFDNLDMTDKLGPEAIRASSAVPGFYPAAYVGAQRYVDGAVLMNTPLKPAIKAGADVLHVIYMNTDVAKMPIEALDSTLETLYRSQIIAWAAAVNADIKRAASYNKSIELMQRAAAGEDLASDDEKVRSFVHAAGPVLQRLERSQRYRPLTIHRYFPPDGLDGALGFLNLERSRVARLIDEGFNNTVNYEPTTAGAVIAPEE